ncbi:MAG: hypothetical protein R2873_35300 [Caldilineaceae bacterium]
MDITTLAATLNQYISSGDLVLPGDALGSDPIQRQFDAFLDDGELRIRQVTAPTVSADNVSVTGIADNLIVDGAQVHARFNLVGDEAALLLSIAPSADWTLVKSFPPLGDTFVSELPMRNPTLTLASHKLTDAAGDDVDPGLSLAATLPMTGPAADVAWLVGDAGELKLRGVIERKDEGTDLAFYARYDKPVPLGFFDLNGVTFGVLAAIAKEDNAVAAVFDFATAIDFGGRTPLRVPLRGSYFVEAKQLQLEADLNQALAAGLYEFDALVDGADLGSVLPDTLAVADQVTLSWLVLDVDVAAKRLNSVRLALSSTQPWTLIDDVLAVEALSLAFRLDDPQGARELSATLMGEVGIG